MNLAILDLLLRGATFGVATAAAIAILACRRPGWPAPLAAFAIAGVGAFILASLPSGLTIVGPAVFAFDAWCLATPGIVWLLAGTLFRDDFRPGPWHLALVGAMVIVTFAGDWGRYRLGPLGAGPELAKSMFMLDIERRRLTLSGAKASEVNAAMKGFAQFYDLTLRGGLTPAQAIERNPALGKSWYDASAHQYGRRMRYYQQVQALDVEGAWERVAVPTLIVVG